MPDRLPLLAPVAGATALGVSLVAVAATVGGELPGNAATWATILLGAAGGLLALLRPGRIWALAGADTLTAIAAVASMFGLGMYELVPLLLLGAATIRTPHLPVPTRERALAAPEEPQAEAQRRSA